MLKAVNVSKTYHSQNGKSCTALNGISIEFAERGLVFITGKSGSGKSTLINVLSGMDTPDSGEITIAGTSSKNFRQTDFDAYRNTYVGYVFQDFGLIDELSVKENIGIALQLQGLDATDKEVTAALNSVGLDDYGDRRSHELSGGQKQRVAIARALIKNPQIIFADEPTGSLDAETGKHILNLFSELAKTRLVIIISHDTDSAYTYGDRIITLCDGKITDDLTKTAEVNLDKLKSEFQQKIYLSFTNTVEVPPSSAKFKTKPVKLPLRHAAKIGFSNFKQKKFRFIFTVILSVVALTLFCLADIMRSYSPVDASMNTFKELEIDTLMLTKVKQEVDKQGDIKETLIPFSEGDRQTVFDKFPSHFEVYPFSCSVEVMFDDEKHPDTMPAGNEIRFIAESDSPLDDTALSRYYGAKLLAGAYPSDKSEKIELLISDYTADSLLNLGALFQNKTVYPNVGYNALLGAELMKENIVFEIAGVYSTDYRAARQNSNYRMFKFNAQYIYPMAIGAPGRIKSTLKAMPLLPATGLLGENAERALYKDYIFFAARQNEKINIRSMLMARTEDIVEKFAIGMADIQTKYAEGYDANSILAENEIVVSYSLLSELRQWFETDDNGLPLHNFDNLTAEDFADFELQFYDFGNTAVPVYSKLKIAAVVNDKSYSSLGSVIITSYELYMNYIDERFSTYCMIVPYGGAEADEELLTSLLADNIVYVTYVSSELKVADTLFAMIEQILSYASLVLFLFVMVLIYNFIATGINDKKREIGILRSIGARGKDTALIFLLESAVIAVLNIVLSVTLTIAGIIGINLSLTSNFDTSLTVLTIKPLSLLYMAVSCTVVVAISSALPMLRMTKLKPVDIIKN